MPYKFEKARILVIDDMRPMLQLTQALLEIFGFKEVYTSDNTDRAFELLCKHNPDLVITDWLMEPVNGLEFTKMVRVNPRSPNPYVPVLMMTGFSSRLRVETARDIGVTEFLVKPFSANDLYKRITQIIEKPRQFVEAGEFFGPDRRRRMAADYEGPKRREEDPDFSDVEIDMLAPNAILAELRKKAKNI